jgi:parallel beta-helix repeat protein
MTMNTRFRQTATVGLATAIGMALLLTLMGGMWLTQHAQAANLDVCSTCTYTTIQAAINAATNNDVIRVAQGSYTGAMTDTGTPFTATVIITKNLTLLGGFNSDFSQHNPQVYTTTIDGQLQPWSVVAMLGSRATVDGFAIINGRAPQNGGGLWIGDRMGNSAVVTVSNNLIAYNRLPGTTPVPGGAGIFVADGSATANILSNNIVSNTIEASGVGGGICVGAGATVVISGNQILSNTALLAGGGVVAGTDTVQIINNYFEGNTEGSIVIVHYASALIQGNTIVSNTASWSGGGIRAQDHSVVTITNNVVAHNIANVGGGGIYLWDSAYGLISGNQIFSNTALSSGGGVLLEDRLTSGVITRNVITANTADVGGGIRVSHVDVFTITDNLIASNRVISSSDGVVEGGGIAVYNSDWSTPSAGYIYNNQILSNTTAYDSGGGGGAGLQLQKNVSTLVLSNTFRDNATSAGGGAIYVLSGAAPVIKNNLILSNTADYGSGIHSLDAWPLVDSNLFAFNSGVSIDLVRAANPTTIVNNVIVHSGDDGVDIDESDSASLVNNTIAFNANGGVQIFSGSTARLRNNIVVSNTNCGINVLSGSVNTVTLEYNDFWGNTPVNYCTNSSPSASDISADPLFVDAANGDYHIRSGSPAMNTGTNVGAPTYDKDGLPRPQGSGVDMGAYEVRVYSIYLPVTLKN